MVYEFIGVDDSFDDSVPREVHYSYPQRHSGVFSELLVELGVGTHWMEGDHIGVGSCKDSSPMVDAGCAEGVDLQPCSILLILVGHSESSLQDFVDFILDTELIFDFVIVLVIDMVLILNAVESFEVVGRRMKFDAQSSQYPYFSTQLGYCRDLLREKEGDIVPFQGLGDCDLVVWGILVGLKSQDEELRRMLFEEARYVCEVLLKLPKLDLPVHDGQLLVEDLNAEVQESDACLQLLDDRPALALCGFAELPEVAVVGPRIMSPRQRQIGHLQVIAKVAHPSPGASVAWVRLVGAVGVERVLLWHRGKQEHQQAYNNKQEGQKQHLREGHPQSTIWKFDIKLFLAYTHSVYIVLMQQIWINSSGDDRARVLSFSFPIIKILLLFNVPKVQVFN